MTSRRRRNGVQLGVALCAAALAVQAVLPSLHPWHAATPAYARGPTSATAARIDRGAMVAPGADHAQGACPLCAARAVGRVGLIGPHAATRDIPPVFLTGEVAQPAREAPRLTRAAPRAPPLTHS